MSTGLQRPVSEQSLEPIPAAGRNQSCVGRTGLGVPTRQHARDRHSLCRSPIRILLPHRVCPPCFQGRLPSPGDPIPTWFSPANGIAVGSMVGINAQLTFRLNGADSLDLAMPDTVNPTDVEAPKTASV